MHLRIDNANTNENHIGLEYVYNIYKDYMDEIKEKDFTNVLELIANAKNAYVYGTGSIQNNVAMEIKPVLFYM